MHWRIFCNKDFIVNLTLKISGYDICTLKILFVFVYLKRNIRAFNKTLYKMLAKDNPIKKIFIRLGFQLLRKKGNKCLVKISSYNY